MYVQVKSVAPKNICNSFINGFVLDNPQLYKSNETYPSCGQVCIDICDSDNRYKRVNPVGSNLFEVVDKICKLKFSILGFKNSLTNSRLSMVDLLQFENSTIRCFPSVLFAIYVIIKKILFLYIINFFYLIPKYCIKSYKQYGEAVEYNRMYLYAVFDVSIAFL
jgi:hypothetical protein